MVDFDGPVSGTVACLSLIIIVIDPLNVSVCRLEQFHSDVPHAKRGDGQIPVPVLLSVVTYVRVLWHHHSQVLL